MSTAIVWTYTPAGFVIGADGRRMDCGSIASDTVQKIFGVRKTNLRLAYAWSGTINVTRMDGLVFDLKHATDLILTSLDMSSLWSFADFSALFGDALHKKLLINIGGGVNSFTKDEIARVVFLAYFREQPCVAEIIVKHDGRIVLKPEINYPHVVPQFKVFSGSERAHREFKTKIVEPASLNEASALVRDYIMLCMAYQSVDPDCANIGGHVHIGKLTREGFRWVDPPLGV